jgi:hypothetical protein
MGNHIGHYEGDKRILPEFTITGKPVRRPVLNTLDIGNGQFIVLDTIMPKRFDLAAEVEKLSASVIVPVSSPVVEDVVEAEPAPDVFGEFSSDTPNTTLKRSR